MKKRGFTIVELVMVVGILAVLLTMVTTAASQSLKASRSKRMDALISIVQTGLATYYAQKGEWPGTVGRRIANGNVKGGSDDESRNNRSNADLYELTSAEVRDTIKDMVDEAKKGNPVMDLTGLFVSRNSGEKGQKGLGLDFITAIRGTKETARKMKTAEMYYGYPCPETGYFRRFKIVYSIPTDQMTVSRQDNDTK